MFHSQRKAVNTCTATISKSEQGQHGELCNDALSSGSMSRQTRHRTIPQLKEENPNRNCSLDPNGELSSMSSRLIQKLYHKIRLENSGSNTGKKVAYHRTSQNLSEHNFRLRTVFLFPDLLDFWLHN